MPYQVRADLHLRVGSGVPDRLAAGKVLREVLEKLPPVLGRVAVGAHLEAVNDDLPLLLVVLNMGVQVLLAVHPGVAGLEKLFSLVQFRIQPPAGPAVQFPQGNGLAGFLVVLDFRVAFAQALGRLDFLGGFGLFPPEDTLPAFMNDFLLLPDFLVGQLRVEILLRRFIERFLAGNGIGKVADLVHIGDGHQRVNAHPGKAKYRARPEPAETGVHYPLEVFPVFFGYGYALFLDQLGQFQAADFRALLQRFLQHFARDTGDIPRPHAHSGVQPYPLAP